MKKIKIISVILITFTFLFFNHNYVFAHVVSKGEIVLDVDSGRVLYESNSNKILPMASTTKIVTCITALENFDPNSIITIKKECCGVEGSSLYLKEGEKYTLLSLLYGLMLRSGNDAAESIADFCGGRDNFVSLMNDFAKKCGAKNTNFTNPHGLHEENHYTTAKDLGLITSYCVKNELFLQICSTKQIQVEELSTKTKRVFINKNKILNMYEGGLGVKTGFTKKSGRCLVSAANRNGMKLVCVVLNSPEMFERSMELMDKCYNSYKMKTLVKKDNFTSKCSINGAENSSFSLKILSDIKVPIKDNENANFKVVLPQKTNFPIKNNEEIGKIDVFVEKKLLFSEKIYTIESVENISYFNLLKIIAENYIGDV